jgi:hypothetical protein
MKAARGASAELDDLAVAMGCQSLGSQSPTSDMTSAWREILIGLPLDERSFNDSFPEARFSPLVRDLSKWWAREYQHPHNRPKHDTLLGFVGLLLLTLLSLAESDRRRNETGYLSSAVQFEKVQGEDRVVHDSCELCKELVKAPSVRRVIEAIYDTGSNFSVKHGDVSGDKSEWRTVVDFSSLEFYRHGTTSIILHCPDENVYGAEYALKLIILPFLRFRGIGEATSEYAKKYNPRGAGTYQSSNARHVVGVLASSNSWILMEFIRGLTLAEFLANPSLVKAKLDHPEMSISDVLRSSLADVPESVLIDKTGLTVERLRYATIDELIRAEATVHSFAGAVKRRSIIEQIAMRCLKRLPIAPNLIRKVSDRRRDRAAFDVSLTPMLVMGASLFLAMEDLRAVGQSHPESSKSHAISTPPSVHGDLTPSNIIVSDGPDISFILIDLGRNYFYTLSMAGYGGADSVFVAPEVRNDMRSISFADVYSIGQLLQFIATGGAVPGRMVADGLYQDIPLIARFVEDLIQEHPLYRLKIFRAADTPDGIDYKEFGKIFKEEVNAVISATKHGHAFANGGFVDTIKDISNPSNGAVRRQFDLWRERIAVDEVRDDEVRRYTGSLFWWSALSASIASITALTVIMWFLRDAQWDWSGQIVEAWSKVTGGNGTDFPGVDSLRVSGYRVPDLRQNWPARLVGISYVLAGTKFYQNVLAGQMPLLGRQPGPAGRRAMRAEFAMRLMSLTAPVLVLIVTLCQAQFWPIASAIGQTIIFFANLFIFRFAVKSLDAARIKGISTAGERGDRLPGLISYGEWVPASFFYAVVVWFFGALIYVHVLHDVGVYAVGVASVNLFLFYVIKCGGESGRDIRIALSRACNAAERVRIVAAAETSPHSSSQRSSRVASRPLGALGSSR